MKEPVERPGRDCRGEQPAARTATQSEPFSKPRTLDEHANALEQKIQARQPVATARGERNHQLVNQSGDDEHRERSAARAEPESQRLENVAARESVETTVPAHTPKLGHRSRARGKP